MKYNDFNGQECEAQLLATKPVHYCDKKKVYYLKCDVAEAERVAKEINDAREHMFSDTAAVYPVDYGCVVVVTSPYND